MVGLIRRGFLNLSPEMFRKLYITFFMPHLEYAQAMWSPKLWKHINLIESVQRRATRIVSALRQFLYEDRLQRLSIPTMEFRRAIGDLVEFYKHLNFVKHLQTSNIQVASSVCSPDSSKQKAWSRTRSKVTSWNRFTFETYHAMW